MTQQTPMQPVVLLVLVAALCLVAAAARPLSVQDYSHQPTTTFGKEPPALAQAFLANWTVSAEGSVTDKAFLSGSLALDTKHGAMRLAVAGAEWLPIYWETTLIANPDVNPGEITFYWFERNNICWTESFSNYYLALFNWSIPEDAQYVEDQTVDGVLCSVWTFNVTLNTVNSLMVWVSKEQTPYGYLVKQAHTDSGYGKALIKFTNSVAGPLDPSIYAPPRMDCGSPYDDTFMAKRAAGFGGLFHTILEALNSPE
ncbi:hypothetical protein QOT17_021004 [Balamuthia mandrillaris]